MSLPRIKVAAAHLAPVWMDAAATAAKACDAVAEAARAGAQLVMFPESYIPGFPAWTALAAPILTHEHFARFAAQSIRADGPELALTAALGTAAAGAALRLSRRRSASGAG